jgi:hypothetical protein
MQDHDGIRVRSNDREIEQAVRIQVRDLEIRRPRDRDLASRLERPVAPSPKDQHASGPGKREVGHAISVKVPSGDGDGLLPQRLGADRQCGEPPDGVPEQDRDRAFSLAGDGKVGIAVAVQIADRDGARRVVDGESHSRGPEELGGQAGLRQAGNGGPYQNQGDAQAFRPCRMRSGSSHCESLGSLRASSILRRWPAGCQSKWSGDRKPVLSCNSVDSSPDRLRMVSCLPARSGNLDP